MSEIRIRLPELLTEHHLNRKQLADKTGIRYATISDMYSGRRKPNLDTLETVLEGLEQLTGKPLKITDLLEVIRKPAPLPSDPGRPALKLEEIKAFHRRASAVRPLDPTDSAITVAEVRGHRL